MAIHIPADWQYDALRDAFVLPDGSVVNYDDIPRHANSSAPIVLARAQLPDFQPAPKEETVDEYRERLWASIVQASK